MSNQRCDDCGRQAGTAADGSVVILFPSNGQNICTDCADERHAKALATAETKSVIEAFMGYQAASTEIIASFIEGRGGVSTSDTKAPSMRQLIHGPYGKRKRAVNAPHEMTPSQVAAAARIGKHGLHVITEKPKAAPVERTSREMMEELEEFKRTHPAPSVEEIIQEKLSPLGLDAKAARQAQIIRAVQEDFMAEAMPLGYSVTTWKLDRNAREIRARFRG